MGNVYVCTYAVQPEVTQQFVEKHRLPKFDFRDIQAWS